jgi:hypothetical protein
MDRSSSRQMKDVTVWLVRNESRTRRLTASSRDGRRERSAARSHQREARIDDLTVPKWAVAFAAAGRASKFRCGKDVPAPGNLPDVLILHAILGQRFAQRVDVEPESCLSHGRLAPDTRHQLPIADDLSNTRGQYAHEVELTVTQGDGPSRPLQSAQCGRSLYGPNKMIPGPSGKTR